VLRRPVNIIIALRVSGFLFTVVFCIKNKKDSTTNEERPGYM